MKEPKVEVRIHAGFTKDGNTERVILYHRLRKALVDNVPYSQVSALLENELENVTLERPYEVYGLLAAYSHEDADQLSAFVYGDTFIQTTLPYCLHLPNGSEYQVRLPEQRFSALITLHKVWTVRATGSSEADFVHDARPTFFTKNSLKTPQFPVDPALGWEQGYTGINVEKLNDTNGVFRYTHVLIELKTGLTPSQLKETDGRRSAAAADLTSKAIDVVNRLLDTYRYVTRESHVERVGSLNINCIYLTKENFGVYVMSALGTGIGSAMMNHPKSVDLGITKMLDAAEQPPFPELLQLDAESSLARHAYILAVVKSFQALEIFVENYIFERYQAAGLAEHEALRVLEVRWRTKERLKDLMRDVSGHSAAEVSGWEEWCKRYDSVRNEVIHRGKEPSEEEAKRVVQLNSELMTWINGLVPAATDVPLAKKILQGRRSIWQRIRAMFGRGWRMIADR